MSPLELPLTFKDYKQTFHTRANPNAQRCGAADIEAILFIARLRTFEETPGCRDNKRIRYEIGLIIATNLVA